MRLAPFLRLSQTKNNNKKLNQATQQSLEELLARVAIRDRAAFNQLYSQTSSKLFGVLLRMLKNEQLAEDVLQDTYVRIWRKADTYRAGRNEPMTWLHSIARYRAIDLIRKHRKESRDRGIDEALEQSNPAFSVLENLERLDKEKLMDCLKELDQDHSDAIVSSYCEGYSHSELSEKLKKPVGTIKSWIRRGLQSLKVCLER